MVKDFSNSRRDFLELTIGATAGLFLNVESTTRTAGAEPFQATASIRNDNPTLKAQFMQALTQVWPQPQTLSLENSYLLGPFENHDNMGWTRTYPPESEPAGVVDPRTTYPGKNGSVRWLRQQNLDGRPAEPVEIVEPAGAAPSTIAYYSGEVQAPEPTAAMFTVQCSGVVKIWLNGALVNAPAIFERANAEGASGWLTLKGGVNRILVKMAFERSSEQTLAVQIKSMAPWIKRLRPCAGWPMGRPTRELA